MRDFIYRFLMDEDGATAVEYAAMVALIIAAVVATVAFLKDAINEAFCTVMEAVAPYLNDFAIPDVCT